MYLSEEDNKKLVEIYQRAKTTPCITFAVDQKDWATRAWEDVGEFMEELGKKYGFDAKKIKGIDGTTGEVLL